MSRPAAPCRPYHARLESAARLDLPDGQSVFKLYCLSLLGRDTPARYEWPLGGLTPAAFRDRLQRLAPAGVGFITAFPHITKIFRFAPAMETVLHVRAFSTADLSPLDLARDAGYIEFACYAEAVIAADEYRCWADAATVADYLAAWSPFAEGRIANPAKLAAHVTRAGPSPRPAGTPAATRHSRQWP